tara:strand:- start:320 stop:1384 length:1065 start_codon:yes stop_codon:yes gene_type:complete
MGDLTPLSASRIKKAQGCSWSYWAGYKLKVPDRSNDGASRGWICHLIFELLGDPRHRDIYDEVILKDSIFLCEPIKRLVGYHARKLNVNDVDNLKLIDNMTMAGLHFDFFGHARGKLEKGISEQSFDLTVDEEGKRYRLRGFIDKLFLYKDTGLALIRDFKSSKSVFKGKEITDNLQDLIYSLAVKKLFPKFDKREVEFLFLKFDLHASGNVKMAEISEYELEGLELYLTGIQEYIDNFDEDDAVSNFAGSQGYPSDGTFGGPLMCGKDGYKISKGEPLLDKEGNPIVAYICPYRKPMNYYVLKNSEGKIVKSFFEEDKDKITPNLEDKETVDFIEYKGCPYWNRDPVEIDDFL